MSNYIVHALQQKHTPYTRGCLGRAFLQPPPQNEESRLHSHPGLPWWSQKLVPLETEKSMRLRLCAIITETHTVCILYTASNIPAISRVRVQVSLPYLLLAMHVSWPTSLLFTLHSFSVCWSSSGMLNSNRPGLLDNVTAPLKI